MTEVHGVSYGAFIVPGLIMLALLTESIGNASFGIYMPKYSGTIYEILSAPVSYFEILVGYVGAAATKSVILGLIIFFTSMLFVDFELVRKDIRESYGHLGLVHEVIDHVIFPIIVLLAQLISMNGLAVFLRNKFERRW